MKKPIKLLPFWILVGLTLLPIVHAESILETLVNTVDDVIGPDGIAAIYQSRNGGLAIDTILTLILFIFLGRETLSKLGKGIGTVIGIILWLGFVIFESTSGFRLASLGPIAAFIIALTIGQAVYSVMEKTTNNKAVAICAAFLAMWFGVLFTISVWDGFGGHPMIWRLGAMFSVISIIYLVVHFFGAISRGAGGGGGGGFSGGGGGFGGGTHAESRAATRAANAAADHAHHAAIRAQEEETAMHAARAAQTQLASLQAALEQVAEAGSRGAERLRQLVDNSAQFAQRIGTMLTQKMDLATFATHRGEYIPQMQAYATAMKEAAIEATQLIEKESYVEARNIIASNSALSQAAAALGEGGPAAATTTKKKIGDWLRTTAAKKFNFVAGKEPTSLNGLYDILRAAEAEASENLKTLAAQAEKLSAQDKAALASEITALNDQLSKLTLELNAAKDPLNAVAEAWTRAIQPLRQLEAGIAQQEKLIQNMQAPAKKLVKRTEAYSAMLRSIVEAPSNSGVQSTLAAAAQISNDAAVLAPAQKEYATIEATNSQILSTDVLALDGTLVPRIETALQNASKYNDALLSDFAAAQVLALNLEKLNLLQNEGIQALQSTKNYKEIAKYQKALQSTTNPTERTKYNDAIRAAVALSINEWLDNQEAEGIASLRNALSAKHDDIAQAAFQRAVKELHTRVGTQRQQAVQQLAPQGGRA